MEGKHILIVEDEVPMSDALAKKLGNKGITTDQAETGNSAISMIDANTYDMVLLDLVLPDGDGFDVLRHMQGRGVKTPVIVLSNLSHNHDIAETKKLGAVAYFVKSNIKMKEVLEEIDKILLKPQP